MRVRSRPNGFSDQMVAVCRDENGRRGCRNLSARPQGLREPRAACTCGDRTRPPPRVIPPFRAGLSHLACMTALGASRRNIVAVIPAERAGLRPASESRNPVNDAVRAFTQGVVYWVLNG